MSCFRLTAALLLCLAVVPVVEAKVRIRAKSAKKVKRKRAKAAPPMVVAPSADIDARVAGEIALADEVLADIANAPDLFRSTFLVSAMYYRDGFLSDFPEDKLDAHPSRRIVSHISRKLTPALRAQFLQRLIETYSGDLRGSSPALVMPVVAPLPKKVRRRTHQWALDLFLDEGSPVLSATRGVVILADHFWDNSDPFSTSSPQGGNSVIIFDPIDSRFYRYCHLNDVQVVAGMLMKPGDRIGAVGHSGWNAARPGHGRHLHWEVNLYRDGAVKAFTQEALLALLRAAISNPASCGTSPCPQ